MLVAACAAAWLGLPRSAAAKAATDKTCIIVLAPYLTWADITPTTTPTLWRLAQTGATGNVNARSRSRDKADAASPLEGALGISAGSWAVSVPTAAGAYSVTERYEVGTAAEAYRRATGNQVGGSAIVFLGMPLTARVNAEKAFEIQLGILGESVEDAGGTTAAVGNSDVGYVTGEQRYVRPAALAAMNAEGLVRFGDVSRRLLTQDANAPFGIATDKAAVAKALKAANHDMAAAGGPRLVVVDAGDVYRAVKFSEQVTAEIAVKQRERGMSTLDAAVAAAENTFGRSATLMVVGQSTGDPALGQAEGIAPLIVSGDGWGAGQLTSDSTHRIGLVTNPDITASALEALGIPQPVSVIGDPVHERSAGDLASRIALLSRMDATAVSVDQAKPGLVNTFVALTIVALLMAAFILVRAREWSLRVLGRGVAVVKALLLLVLALPMCGWLMFGFNRWPGTSGQAITAYVVTVAIVWAIGILLWWKTGARVPVAVLSLATAATIVVDQWLGAPASFTNFYGYSPLLAARFYGMGNEAAAILFGSSIVGLALLVDEWPEHRFTVYVRRFGLPLVGLIAIMTAAAPFWGANVGVAIWGVVGYGLAWVLMNGHHVSWRIVFWLFLGVVVIIAAFAAIDLFGGGPQTHLGRALTSAQSGGLVELWNIIVRKAETNARVLTRTNWAYILLAVLAFLGLMRWRPQGGFADTLIENPNFADAITVSLVAGLVAYFTEDSGIVIPALEVFYVGIGLSWVMLSHALQQRRRAEATAAEDRASER